MGQSEKEERWRYNLDGGQRILIVKNGVVKAVAPGLRLVPATEAEEVEAHKDDPPPEPIDYGLPV